MIIMKPEIMDQVSAGILMKTLLTLRSRVKIIMDAPNEAVMIIAFFRLGMPETELPTITGNKVSVHGASTVRIPAMNESNNSSINQYARLAAHIGFIIHL